jgi:hypothetical protein
MHRILTSPLPLVAIALFCDASVHNSPDKRKQDQIERDNLRYNTGYTVLTLRHDQDWAAKFRNFGDSVI